MEKSILLKNIALDGRTVDIMIAGGRIADICDAVGNGSAPFEAQENVDVVDCTGKTAFPGLINMHTHAGMTLMRGVGEDIA